MKPVSDVETFSTNGMPPNQSIKVWRRYMSEIYYRLDVQQVGSDRIEGLVSRRTLSKVKATRLHSSAYRVVRTNELAKLDRIESHIFVFSRSGTQNYRQGNRNNTVSVGQSYILNSSECYQVDLSDNTDIACLELPSDIVRDRIARIDDFCRLDLAFDPLITRTLSNITRQVVDAGANIDADVLQDLCLQLIDIGVTSAGHSIEDFPRPNSLDDLATEKILQVIAERLSNSAFSLVDLATACGVSKRQVQNLLSKRNTTFSQELMDARLARATQLLRSRQRTGASIGEIAVQCGFGNQAHFSTSYRRRYGKSPREDR